MTEPVASAGTAQPPSSPRPALCPPPPPSPSRGQSAGRRPSSPPGRSRRGRGAARRRLSPGRPAGPEGKGSPGRLPARPAAGAAEHWAPAVGRREQGREGARPSRGRPGHAHTHANGHEVYEDDEVPQVVKAAVAEEELGALQKRGLVLGRRRVLEGTHGQRMGATVAAPPSTPKPPGDTSAVPQHLHAPQGPAA